MSTYGVLKASAIASVAAALKNAAMPALGEDAKEVIAGQVGALLDDGYDFADIRYAACEIALAGESTWSLAARVRSEFSPVRPAIRPAASAPSAGASDGGTSW